MKYRIRYYPSQDTYKFVVEQREPGLFGSWRTLSGQVFKTLDEAEAKIKEIFDVENDERLNKVYDTSSNRKTV